jgi:hypothetical protein
VERQPVLVDVPEADHADVRGGGSLPPCRVGELGGDEELSGAGAVGYPGRQVHGGAVVVPVHGDGR